MNTREEKIRMWFDMWLKKQTMELWICFLLMQCT